MLSMLPSISTELVVKYLLVRKDATVKIDNKELFIVIKNDVEKRKNISLQHGNSSRNFNYTSNFRLCFSD